MGVAACSASKCKVGARAAQSFQTSLPAPQRSVPLYDQIPGLANDHPGPLMSRLQELPAKAKGNSARLHVLPASACRVPASFCRVPTALAPPLAGFAPPRPPHAAFPPAFTSPPRSFHYPLAASKPAPPRPTATTSQGPLTSWPGNSRAPTAGGAAPLP